MAWTIMSFPFMSVLTSAQMTNLYNDITAQANGDSGAPPQQTAGIADGAITNIKNQPPISGTSYLIKRIQEAEATSASISYPSADQHIYFSNNQHLGCHVLVSGTITAYAEHHSTSSAGSYLRVMKNGVLVTEWSTTSGTYVARSVNIAVTVGDVIVFQQRTLSGTYPTYWRYIRVYSNNQNFAVA